MRCAVLPMCMLCSYFASVACTGVVEYCSESSHPVYDASLLQRSVKSPRLRVEGDKEILKASMVMTSFNSTLMSGSDQPSSLEMDLYGCRRAFDRATPGFIFRDKHAKNQAELKLVPKVAFLFLVKDGLDQEAVWDMFFEQAQEDQYSIYVHSASPQEVIAVPLSKWGAVLVPQVPTRWGAISGAEVAVFSEALTDQANTQFVLVSDATVPLKPFHYVHSQLVSKSPHTSKICFTQEKLTLNLKHHQWVVLSRQHAFTFVENAESAINMTYATLQKVDAGCCSDELAVAIALLPDQAAKDPPTAQSALHEKLEEIGVERACLTWVSWYDLLNGTPLDLAWWYAALNGPSLNGAPHHFGPPEEDPTVKLSYLEKLVTQEGFMFGRKFNSGCLVDVGTHQLPLSTELSRLWDQVIAEKVSSRVWWRLDAEGAPKEPELGSGSH